MIDRRIYAKDLLKNFKSATQEIYNSIPKSASLFDAIAYFLERYEEKSYRYDAIFDPLSLDYRIYPIENVRLFYICMTLRGLYKNYFPSPSLCLNISYALKNEIYPHCVLNLYISSVELLPVLFLLPNDSIKIAFDGKFEEMLSPIIKLYVKSHSTFSWKPMDEVEDKSKYISLLQFSTLQAAKDEEFLLQVKDFGTTVLYTSWNFLSNLEYRSLRCELLSKRIIDKVIQLYLPSREGSTDYPSLVVLNQERVEDILMLDLGALSTKYFSGIINEMEENKFNFRNAKNEHKEQFIQELIVDLIHLVRSNSTSFPDYSLILNKYIESHTIVTSTFELLEEKDYRLTPSFYIAKNNSSTSNAKTLGNYVQVLRYQGSRESVKEEITTKDSNEFGNTLFREASLKDLEEVTGFYVVDDADFTRINDFESKFEKYLLKNNDIVFAYKGSKVTIGTVGFINDALNCLSEELINKSKPHEIAADKTIYSVPAIPGNSFVILRSEDYKVDPLYLFYYLQQEEIQALIKSKVSGTSVLSINTTAIKSIPFALPSKEKVEEVHRYYRCLESDLRKMINYKRSIKIKKSLYKVDLFK